MPTIFYVDAENTQADWLGILPFVKKSDTVHLFTSPAVTMKAQPPTGPAFTLVVHHCKGGHKNAMDFEIAATLGYLCRRHPKHKHLVISKDLGFDYATRALPNENVQRLSPHSFIEKASTPTKVVT